MQLHMMLPGLLSHPDKTLIPAFLDSLATGAPSMLADLVMALMLFTPLPSLAEVTARLEEEQKAATESESATATATATTTPPTASQQPQQPNVEQSASAAAPGGASSAQAGPAVATAQTVAGGLPTTAAMSALLKRPFGSSPTLRHLPAGQLPLPLDLPPTAAGAAAAAAAPAPPPALAAALKARAPLIPTPRLSVSAMQALRAAAVRRVAIAGGGGTLAAVPEGDSPRVSNPSTVPVGSHLPVKAREPWEGLLARLATMGDAATVLLRQRLGLEPPMAAEPSSHGGEGSEGAAEQGSNGSATAMNGIEEGQGPQQQVEGLGPGGGKKRVRSMEEEDAVHHVEEARQATDSLHELLLEQALAGLLAGQQQGLAVRWLYALFAEQCRLQQAAQRAAERQQHRARRLRRRLTSTDQPPDQAYADEQRKEKGKASLPSGAQVSPMEEDDSKPLVDQGLGQQVKAEKKEEAVAVFGKEETAQGQQQNAGGDEGSAEPEERDEGEGGEVIVQPLELSGTRYEAALLALLERLREAGQWQVFKHLLSESPALPLPSTQQLLADLVAQGGEAASTALTGAREVVLARPGARHAMMELVLDAAYSQDPDTRSKAVRLCCNQLAIALQGALAPGIIGAATEALHALLAPPPDDAAPDAAGAAAAGAEGAAAPAAEWTTPEALRYCELYTTLCVRHHELLPGLMTVFASAPAPVKAALMTSSEALAKALGHSNPQLVALVRDPPAGSEPLVWHMLEVLMSVLLPSEAMLVACRQRASATGDVSSLVPVVAVLNKGEVVTLLPRLLQVADLNLRQLYRKLATPQGALGGEPLFTPAELLVALHALDPRQDGIPPRVLIAAVDGALHAPDVFPQQAIAQALQQMESRPVLPLLFMRSVITALKALPKLKKFVSEVLARLISRQIWQDVGQWRGFLLLIEHTGKPYFPLLLQLPVPVLASILGLTDTANQQSTNPNEPRLAHDKAVQLAAWALQTSEVKAGLLSPVAALLERVMDAHRLQQQASEQAVEQVAAALAAAEQQRSLSLSKAESGAVAAAAAAAAAPAGEAGGLPEQPEQEEEEDETEEGAEAGDGAGGDAAAAATAGVGGGRQVDEFDLDFQALEEEEAAEARAASKGRRRRRQSAAAGAVAAAGGGVEEGGAAAAGEGGEGLAAADAMEEEQDGREEEEEEEGDGQGEGEVDDDDDDVIDGGAIDMAATGAGVAGSSGSPRASAMDL